jgi:hypothetical protein
MPEQHWTKSVIKIKVTELSIAFGNKACFKPINGTIQMVFDVENSFRSNHISSRWSWN